MKDSKIDKLRKLEAHERSARSIGSVAEADQFAEKIRELREKYPKVELETSDAGETCNVVGCIVCRAGGIEAYYWENT